MSLLSKIFTSRANGRKQKKGNEIIIYLDSECKRFITIRNQNVQNYVQDRTFDSDEFIYLCVKFNKTGEIILKRKLCLFQNLGQCLQNITNQQYKGYLIVGYSNERNIIPKVNPVSINQSLTFIRTGTVRMNLDSKKAFEECVLKLHHDYLTYIPSKCKLSAIQEKKISFIPLENASVDIYNQKQYSFKIKDKYRGIIFKSASKQDMFLWVISISAAIETRCSQMYMKDLNQKIQKKVKDKLGNYKNRCSNMIKDNHNRSIFLDEIGKRSLQSYFKANNQNDIDIKMFNVFEKYKQMCKIKRQKGEQESQPMIHILQDTCKSLRDELPQKIKDKNFDSKQDLIKAIEQIVKYLDQKYKKILLQKKIIQATFETQLLNQHRENSKIQVKTLFGNTLAAK